MSTLMESQITEVASPSFPLTPVAWEWLIKNKGARDEWCCFSRETLDDLYADGIISYPNIWSEEILLMTLLEVPYDAFPDQGFLEVPSLQYGKKQKDNHIKIKLKKGDVMTPDRIMSLFVFIRSILVRCFVHIEVNGHAPLVKVAAEDIIGLFYHLLYKDRFDLVVKGGSITENLSLLKDLADCDFVFERWVSTKIHMHDRRLWK
jgi:hypothetical protein